VTRSTLWSGRRRRDCPAKCPRAAFTAKEISVTAPVGSGVCPRRSQVTSEEGAARGAVRTTHSTSTACSPCRLSSGRASNAVDGRGAGALDGADALIVHPSAWAHQRRPQRLCKVCARCMSGVYVAAGTAAEMAPRNPTEAIESTGLFLFYPESQSAFVAEVVQPSGVSPIIPVE
jgi:hypothetical protein